MSRVSQISYAFRKTFFDFPKQFRVGLEATKALASRKLGANHLIICGMGGSALPGAFLSDLFRHDPRLQRKHVHVVVHRDYGLPPEATNSKAVVMVVSYSGNTEETISTYQEARKKHLSIFVVASGGKLARFAERDGVPLAKIPTGVEPRFAVGYQFGALVGILMKLGFLPSVFQKELLDLEKTLRPKKLLHEAKALAAHFSQKRFFPLIYGSPRLAAATYSWKTNIHENAKILASSHIFPELNHNELNSFTPLTKIHKDALSHLFVIMIEDPNDHPRTKKRFALTARLIARLGIPVKRITITGKNTLTRIFTANLLGLAFSGALAERLGIDPLEVPIIETFKKKLNVSSRN